MGIILSLVGVSGTLLGILLYFRSKAELNQSLLNVLPTKEKLQDITSDVLNITNQLTSEEEKRKQLETTPKKDLTNEELTDFFNTVLKPPSDNK